MDLVGRMLQLFAEGHNLNMQRLMRGQHEFGFRFSNNLVMEAVALLQASAKNQMVIRQMSDDEAEDVGKVLDFLIEVTQGPCSEIQDMLASSGMVDVCKSIIEAEFRNADPKTAKEVKENAVTALTALIEGRPDNAVHQILAEKLDVRTIRKRLAAIFGFYKANREALQDAEEDESYLSEGFDLLTMADELGKVANDKFDEKFLRPDKAIYARKLDPSMFDSKKKFRAEEKKKEAEVLYKEAYQFFEGRVRSIEIYWNKQIQRVTFPLQSECDFIKDSIKDKIKSRIDYTDDDKVDEFLEGVHELQTELKHFEYLNRFGFYRYVGQNLDSLKTASFALALMMNFIMVISLEKGYTASGMTTRDYSPAYMKTVQQSLGIVQLVTSCLVLAFKLINLAPLVYKKVVLRRKKLDLNSEFFGDQAAKELGNIIDAFGPLVAGMVACFCVFGLLFARFTDSIAYVGVFGIIIFVGSLLGAQGLRKYWQNPVHDLAFVYTVGYDTLTSSDTLFYVLYVICAVLGVTGLEFFYCFHLLDLVLMSNALQNVVRSVTSPIVSLGMTSILTLFCVYIFALLGFFLFDGDFYNADAGVDECKTMILCFFTFVHNGLIPGGGIGDYMSFELGWQPYNAGGGFYEDLGYTGRLIFDLLFFIGVLVLLLNIIFGIILDTFSELREDAKEKHDIMTGECFVCGIDKNVFDDEAMKNGEHKGFLRHISTEHNMWDYMFFIMFLENKDSTEFTGAETYVQTCLDKNDIKWVPKKRALCFDDDDDDEDSFEEVIEDTTKEIQDLAKEKAKEMDDSVKDVSQKIKSMLGDSVRELQEKVKALQDQLHGTRPSLM
jgi:hypothetical protein